MKNALSLSLSPVTYTFAKICNIPHRNQSKSASMDEDDDPNANQAGRSANLPEISAQKPDLEPSERKDPSEKRESEGGKRESWKRNVSDPAQSKSKVADDKKTPPWLTNSVPKGVEGAPPVVDLAKSTNWADTSELAEELGWITTVQTPADSAPKGAEGADPAKKSKLRTSTKAPQKLTGIVKDRMSK